MVSHTVVSMQEALGRVHRRKSVLASGITLIRQRICRWGGFSRMARRAFSDIPVLGGGLDSAPLGISPPTPTEPIVQVISLEANNEQRQRLRCALDLTGKPYTLREISNLNELLALADAMDFSLALVGSAVLNDALSAIVFLRGRMPAGHIIAYGEFLYDDAHTPRRLRDAGAHIVLDTRFSPSKMALVIERFIWSQQTEEENRREMPYWAIRRAVQAIAPRVYAK